MFEGVNISVQIRENRGSPCIYFSQDFVHMLISKFECITQKRREKKMKRQFGWMLVGMLVLVFAGAAHGAIVNLTADDFVTVDGASYDLVSPQPPTGAGLMWEPDGSGGYKACICRMVAFRALQAVGQHVNISDFNSADTHILTGWNTDGPEELYVDNMPWVKDTNFAYADSMTPNEDLTRDDAWYQYTIGGQAYRVESRAGNYEFTHDDQVAGYHADWDFFDYRSYVKGGGTGDEKTYFSGVVRSQIVDNFKGATSFDVNPVPVPAAVWLLGSGLVGLVGLRRRNQ
jgi:hypothetical protein